jgi:hypothetical protein
MIGVEKPLHYNRVFAITSFTINGIDCNTLYKGIEKIVETILREDGE